MRARIGLAGAVLLMLAGGCASQAAAPSSAPVAASSGCPQSLTIQPGDGGDKLCVAVGGTVTINWDGMTEPEASGTALVLNTGAQAPKKDSYDAKTKGTVTFTSSRAACSPSPGQMNCGALIAWNVTVEVK